jgi:hypothetical protein
VVGGGAMTPLEIAARHAAHEPELRAVIPLSRDPYRSQRVEAGSERGWRRGLAALSVRLLARFSSAKAARRGAELFLSPTRRPLTQRERGVLASARRDWVPFAGRQIPLWIWEGASYRPPTVLLVHDWGGCGADLAAFVAPLRLEGARVIAFDAPAHGEASGHLTDIVEFAATLALLLRRHSEWAPPRGVIAHGFGALAATHAVAAGAPAERLVYLAAAENFVPYLESFRREAGIDEALLESVRHCVERRLGRTLESLRGARFACNLDRPLVAFHDADDFELFCENSRMLVDRWTGARFVRTFGLGHRGLLEEDAVLAAAVEHLLGESAESAASPAPPAGRSSGSLS